LLTPAAPADQALNTHTPPNTSSRPTSPSAMTSLALIHEVSPKVNPFIATPMKSSTRIYLPMPSPMTPQSFKNHSMNQRDLPKSA
jgi:hypothetical protein